jgi:tRNA(Ser,Leu) C12 N-acetylase TAN1
VSVRKVILEGVDERYEPPDREIEVSIVGDSLYISVFDGSVDDLSKSRKKEIEVPELSLKEFRAALDYLEKWEDTRRKY